MEDLSENIVKICEDKLAATATIFVDSVKPNAIQELKKYLSDNKEDMYLKDLPISQKEAKAIMKLHVYGTAYLAVNYRCSIGLATLKSAEIITYLESLTYEDMLNKPLDEGILAEYLEFQINSSYLAHTKAQEYIVEAKILKEYLKIYPFGLLTMDLLLEPLSYEESIVLEIINIYNQTYLSFSNANKVSDEEFWAKFIMYTKMKHDNLTKIYQCLIANVYKFVFVTNATSKTDESNQELIEYIESTPVNEIIGDLEENAELAIEFLEYFYITNRAITKGFIEETNWYFNQNNDGEVLNRIKHYNDNQFNGVL